MNPYLLVLILYSLVLIGLGLVLSRHVKSSGDFYVAGRKLSPGLLFATMLAANIGAGSTVGAAGLGYSIGLSAWWWVGSAGIGSLILAATVGPRIRDLSRIPFRQPGPHGHRCPALAGDLVDSGRSADRRLPDPECGRLDSENRRLPAGRSRCGPLFLRRRIEGHGLGQPAPAIRQSRRIPDQPAPRFACGRVLERDEKQPDSRWDFGIIFSLSGQRMVRCSPLCGLVGSFLYRFAGTGPEGFRSAGCRSGAPRCRPERRRAADLFLFPGTARNGCRRSSRDWSIRSLPCLRF